MKSGTLIGLAAGTVFIIFAILQTAGGDISEMRQFLHGASTLVVVGGTLASGLIAVELRDFVISFKAFAVAFRPPPFNPTEAIDRIVALSNTARKEGVLALEETAAKMEDKFLQKGIMLIVDGTDPELVKGIMETELGYIEERHGKISAFYESLAAYAPSWGMIGTMVGLVIMLGRMTSPDEVGAGMSVALITTMYGCILANFLFNPIAAKLKSISGKEILLKTVIVEGMLSIQAGENPRIVEEKLKSFLAPALRGDVGKDERSVES